MPTMDMALDTTDMDSDTTARGLLRRSPRPRLILITLVDTMVDMVLVMLTTDMALDTMDMDSDTMARGLLMPSLRPRLIPTTLVDTTVDMVLVMPTTDMALDTTDMGLDTMVDMAVDTMVDMDMVLATMAMGVVFMATMDKSIYPYFIPIPLQTHTFSESTAATMSAQKEEFILLVGTPSAASFSV